MRLIITAICALVPALAFASPGETGMASAKIGIGGKAVAMGDAGITVSDGPDAMYWNPAGLVRLKGKTEFQFMRNQWLQDGNTGNYLGFAMRLGRFILGSGVSSYSSTGIGLYGNVPRDDGPLGEFSAHDATASLAAAYAFANGVEAGMTVNGLYAKIFDESAAGASVNAGIGYSRYDGRLKMGAAVRHAGGTDKMYRERIVLPLTFGGGASYLFTLGDNAHLLLCSDLTYVRSGAPRLLSGAEFRFRALSARAGYKTSHEYYNDAFTFGGGVAVKRIRVDYAFVPFADGLGNTHRFSFILAL